MLLPPAACGFAIAQGPSIASQAPFSPSASLFGLKGQQAIAQGKPARASPWEHNPPPVFKPCKGVSIAPGPNLFRPCRAQREEGAAPQSQGVALTGFALGYGLSAFQAEDGLSRHRLEAVFADGRPVLILSREDFLAGLLEHGGYRIPGYAPASASALMTNILTLASQKKLAADTPTTRPATQPAP